MDEVDEVDGAARGASAGQDPTPGSDRRMTVFVRGRVQGVGFRWWTRARALELGLAGHARNTADGRVEVVAEGSEDALHRLHVLLREEPSTTRRPGGIRSVSTPAWSEPRGATGFVER